MAGPRHLLFFVVTLALWTINVLAAQQVLVPLRRGMPVYHSLTKRDAGVAFNDTSLLNTTNMLYGNPGSKRSLRDRQIRHADSSQISQPSRLPI